MTLLELNKVCPRLFDNNIYYRFIDELSNNLELDKWNYFDYQFIYGPHFIKEFDISKLQVLQVDYKYHGYEYGQYDWFLILKHIN